MQGIFSTLARLGRLLGAPRRLLGSGVGNLRSVFQILVAAGFSWFVASSLYIYPHSLSYANELIGGPIHLPKHLVGSSVDWGQDLGYLKIYLESLPNASNVSLRCSDCGFSLASAVLGEKTRMVAPHLVSRQEVRSDSLTFVAISATVLQSQNVDSFPSYGTQFSVDTSVLRESDKFGRAGYSMLVYRIDDKLSARTASNDGR